MKMKGSFWLTTFLIQVFILILCECYDEPEGFPKAVLATTYMDEGCTIREGVNDNNYGPICHILGECYSITQGVWNDESGLMYAVYGFLPISSTNQWEFSQTVYWDNACTWQELPQGFSVMSFPCELNSCCPTVVASNLNEPYQQQSAPEDYVWRYVRYTIVSEGVCPDNLFKDGENELGKTIGDSGHQRTVATANVKSTPMRRSLLWSFLFIVICSIAAVIAIVYQQELRKLYHERMVHNVIKSGNNIGGAYEVVLDNGFEGVDTVPALWTRPA